MIAQAIAAGPQQGFGLLIDGLVKNFSPQLLSAVTAGNAALEKEASEAAIQMELTQTAVQSGSVKIAGELPQAIELQQITAKNAMGADRAEHRSRDGDLGGQVQSIAHTYGIVRPSVAQPGCRRRYPAWPRYRCILTAYGCGRRQGAQRRI